ncbi:MULTISPECIES: AraC family transcriptional regulator [Dethiosulfovibrio]|uniref:AraC family transcriptional regulator n=2 Tax=Dethiosulfovibrio TaxID=47054 RepID=A0ABS9EPJ5_9BACT|nr:MULTISPECIES: AraC family transcriptional regulator [Dethiosulfovibrio]MCF4114900.1 AraC family transcriptional regulator [Dethiosulfovibrio russensis]MCF4142421.1 AraC family transcriptional regulator [Dethiosulfovibrio marinus]MCF4145392.1 AraC family transcriptional regulator [Dethiosulfovibrio acidaminovorans]
MSDTARSCDDRIDTIQRALAMEIDRRTRTRPRLETEIAGLVLIRGNSPTEPLSYTMDSSICLIAQGRKRIFLGEESYIYDDRHFLITSVDLPVVAQILEASEEKPYLGLTLELDKKTIAQLIMEVDSKHANSRRQDRGMEISEATPNMLEAFLRLVNLLKSPEDLPVLGPMVKREIFYRLLTGEQGPKLRRIVTAGSHSHSIANTIEWLRRNFADQIKMDELASRSGMSQSTFHHHFRSVTAMSPLQFQKRLRLNEARRLMLTERLDAATAAFQVGYESPSQFSREYKRLFGAPPAQDVKNMIRI